MLWPRLAPDGRWSSTSLISASMCFLQLNLPFFLGGVGGGGVMTTWQLTFFYEDCCYQTERTLKLNSPCRYVREELEVAAFHREKRQRRVGVPHIPVLWLIQCSKNHLDFKVPSWLHLNVKCIKIHEKKSGWFIFSHRYWKPQDQPNQPYFAYNWLCWQCGGVKQPHRWWTRCFPSWLMLVYSSCLACSNLLLLPTNQLVAPFWAWEVYYY